MESEVKATCLPKTVALKALHVSAIALALAWLTGPVQAELVTVEVTGTVTYINTEGGFVFDGLGSSMTGACTYDTATPDLFPDDAYYGKYAIESLSMTIGNYVFAHDPLAVDYPTFQVWRVDITYVALTESGIVSVGGDRQDYVGIDVTLIDLCNAATIGPDDSLPTSFPDISFFTYRNGFRVLYSGNDVGFEIRGVLDSIHAVPEPCAILLLGLGALGLRKKQMYKRVTCPPMDRQ